jgi:hypothetical protein
VGGVGKTLQVDEWGRDDDLGFASQTALFRRIESDEAAASRDAALHDAQVAIMRKPNPAKHTLLAAYLHKAHPSARHPLSIDKIGHLVEVEMLSYREEDMLIRDLWNIPILATSCGGWIGVLLEAVATHPALTLIPDKSQPRSEWGVHCDGIVPAPSADIRRQSSESPRRESMEEEERMKEATRPSGYWPAEAAMSEGTWELASGQSNWIESEDTTGNKLGD